MTYESREAVAAAQDDVARTVKGVVYATHAEAKAEREKKTVGFFLGFLILMVPYFACFYTLRKGYSTRARLISFGWLAFLAISMFRSSHDITPPAAITPPPVAAASPIAPPPEAPAPEAPLAVSPSAAPQETLSSVAPSEASAETLSPEAK